MTEETPTQARAQAAAEEITPEAEPKTTTDGDSGPAQATVQIEQGTVEEQPAADADGEPADDLAVLLDELEETKAQAAEYLDGWQRAQADFSNYKKRMKREQAQIYQTTTGSIIKHYLDIIDDLDLALKNRPEDGDGASWANGIELIYRKLLTILENEGVAPMEVEGELFDPNFHEAITSEPNDDYESGQIIEVIKNGYLIGERVLRPAMVRVAQ